MHFEDFVEGETHAFGHVAVASQDIIAFARAFDPQPFHLSEEAAKETNIGRLIASGYHTCAMLMRMAVDGPLGGPEALGAPSVEEARFLKPVLPNDTLSARLTVRTKRALKSRPKVGVMHCLMELVNQRDEIVMTWDINIMRRMRGLEPSV